MEVNKYYYNKFNKYVEQITKVGSKIELKNLDGVKSTIKQEYFNDNYILCNDIYSYVNDMLMAFKPFKHKLTFTANTILLSSDDETITFYVQDDLLVIVVSKGLQDMFNIPGNRIKYKLDNTKAVINMIANLFTED